MLKTYASEQVEKCSQEIIKMITLRKVILLNSGIIRLTWLHLFYLL